MSATFSTVRGLLARIAADPGIDPKLAERLREGDPRLDEWTADARAEVLEERRERADSYRTGGFGL